MVRRPKQYHVGWYTRIALLSVWRSHISTSPKTGGPFLHEITTQTKVVPRYDISSIPHPPTCFIRRWDSFTSEHLRSVEMFDPNHGYSWRSERRSFLTSTDTIITPVALLRSNRNRVFFREKLDSVGVFSSKISSLSHKTMGEIPR